MTLEHFEQRQHDVRKRLKRDVASIENEIKEKLVESTTHSMQVFRNQNRITLSQNAVAMPNQAQLDSDDDDDNKNAFLVGDDTRKQMPYTQKATIRQQCKRLVRYIKLVDYLAIDSKLSAIENSLRKVLSYIMFDFSHGERLVVDNRIQDQPIFQVQVVADEYNPLEISFIPPLEDLNTTLSTIVKKAMLVVCQAGEYLSHDEFQKYTVGSGDFTPDQLQNKKLDLFDMALEKNEFIKLRMQIDDRMNETFSIIREKSRELSLYLEIYEKNMQFRAQSFREADVDKFKPTIERFLSEDKMLEEFNPIIDIHTVRLNAVGLKNKIKNCPNDCLMALKKLMPLLSEERLLQLRDELKTAEERLDVKPNTVDEYVSFMRYVKQLEEQVDQFTIRFDDCKTLHQIMEEYKIRIPEGNKLKFNETYTVLNSVRGAVERAITESETSEIKWQKELASQLPVVDQKADNLIEQLMEGDISDPKADVSSVVKKLRMIGVSVSDVQELSIKLQDHQTFLNMEVTKFESVETLMKQFLHKEKLWNGLQGWANLTEQWITEPFLELDVDFITNQVQEYFVTALACKDNLDPENPMPGLFLSAIQQFRKMLPLLTYLRSAALTKRHWSEINKIVGTSINPKDDPELTLKRLMEIRVPEKTEQIGQVTMKAEKEKELGAKMEQIKSQFMTARLPIIPYKDSKDYFAIGPGVEETLQLLQSSMQELNIMLNSKFISPLLSEVEKLYKRMVILQEFIEECVIFQRRWSQIESLFTSSDMLRYVPNQVKRYNQVDGVWKSLMKSAGDQPLLNKFGAFIKENPVELFRINNRVLEDIERGLSEWFEKKRFEFPRFFFISNQEILFFLSGNRNIEPLQPHFVKLFPAVKALDVSKMHSDSEKQEDIIGLTSLQYEKFFFTRVVKARGFIDQWLQQIENEVQKTLKRSIKVASEDLENAEIPKDRWMSITPVSQILLTSLNVYFVRTTELVLTDPDWNENMPSWKDDHYQFIEDVKKVMFDTINKVSVSQFYTIRSLLLTANYQRDIIDELYRNKITSITDYTWRKQIRTYLEDELVVRQAQSSIQYGYEYQGSKPRLPVVPSTERCWLSACQALSSKYAACAVGGYGSSKAETIKDFAAIHGKYLLELPNPQQFSTSFLELILFGMMSTNAWINILEVNHLESECLSLLGHYISAVRASLQSVGDVVDTGYPGSATFKKEITLDGRHFTLTQPLGLFCTLNPAVSARHGLSHVRELPRGLSQNLRSIAMMQPDNIEMFELILTVSGFSNGRVVAKKLVQWADLLRSRLLQQEREPTIDLSFRYLRTLIEAAALGFKSALFSKVQELMAQDQDRDETSSMGRDSLHSSRVGTPLSVVVHDVRDEKQQRRHTLMPPRQQTITRQSLGKSPAPYLDLTSLHLDRNLLRRARARLNEVKLLYQVIQMFVKDKLGESEISHFKDVMHDVFTGCEDKTGGRSTFAREAFQSYPGELSTDVTHRAPLEKFQFSKKMSLVKEVMDVHGFEYDRRLAPKIIQLAQLIQNSQRGVVILGPPDQGKSTVWKVAQLLMHEEEQLKLAEDHDSESARNLPKPDYRILYPNAYSMSELYGWLHKAGQERSFEDAARETVTDSKLKSPSQGFSQAMNQQSQQQQTQTTNEWVEGQIGAVIRNFLKVNPNVMNWVVLDGELKPWADPLLNLLDEPYTLFLRTGERLKLTNSNIRIVFETDNISKAPPNILGKTSIFLQRPPNEPENADQYSAADWRSLSVELIKSKLTLPVGGGGNLTLPQEALDYIIGLCDNFIPKGLTFLHKGLSHVIPCTDFQFIRNLISLLQALLIPPVIYKQQSGSSEIESSVNLKLPMEMLKKVIIKCFIFAFSWSFAGHLGHLARPKWDSFISDQFHNNDLPKHSVFDSYLNFSKNFGDYENWQQMSDTMSQIIRSESQLNAEMIIPTKNYVTYATLARMNIQTGHPVLLVGQRSCGKTVVMRKVISEMRKICNMRVFSTAFCTRTNPLDFQQILETKLERRGRALLTGPNYKPAAIVIEDMHLPTVFDCPPHGFLYDYQSEYKMNEPYTRFDGSHVEHVPELFEFMVQVLDQHSFTDRERHFQVGVEKCSFAFTGSRSAISASKTLTKRHLRFIQVLNMPPETEQTLLNIFQPTIERHLNSFKQEVKDLGKAVINGSFLVYQAIQRELKPCPSKPTYFFTIRHLANIFTGIQFAGVTGSNRPDKLTRLWVHEFERQIGDALSHDKDRGWLRRHLQSMVNTQFRFDWNFQDLFVNKQTLYGNFMNKQVHVSERRYEELRDMETLERTLEEYVLDFNQEESGKNRLSITIVEHVARQVAHFARVFSFNRQHLLVVGQRVAGSSQALRLASYICKHECETCEGVHKLGYQLSTQRMRRQIRRILLQCGLHKKSTVFIIDEEQFRGNRTLLQDLQMLMSCREIPGLLDQEDMTTIEQMLRQRTGDEPQQIYDLFRNNIHQSLHLALIMRGDNSQLLRERIRIAPGLYSYCRIQYLLQWPISALHDVARKVMKRVQDVMGKDVIEKVQGIAAEQYNYVLSVEDSFNTQQNKSSCIVPQNFVQHVRTADVLFEELSEMFKREKESMETGVEAMKRAEGSFRNNTLKLERLQEKIAQKVAEEDAQIKVIESIKTEAMRQKEHIDNEIKANNEILMKVNATTDKAAKRKLQGEYDSNNVRIDKLRKEWQKVAETVKDQEKKLQLQMKSRESLDKDKSLLDELINESRPMQDFLKRYKKDWKKRLDQINKNIESLPGRCLIVGAMISYTGRFDLFYRKQAKMQFWHASNDYGYAYPPKTAEDRDFVLTEAIPTMKGEYTSWRTEGLPQGDQNKDSAVMVMRSLRRPLIIDPVGLVSTWLGRARLENDIRLMPLDGDNFTRELCSAIKMGFEVMVTGISHGNIPSILLPILENRTYVGDKGKIYIKIEGQTLPYDPKFRMYLFTSEMDPILAPRFRRLLNVINFGFNRKGVEAALVEFIVNIDPIQDIAHKPRDLATLGRETEQLERRRGGYENDLITNLAEINPDVAYDEKSFSFLEDIKKLVLQIEDQIKEVKRKTAQEYFRRISYIKPARQASLHYQARHFVSLNDPFSSMSFSVFRERVNAMIIRFQKNFSKKNHPMDLHLLTRFLRRNMFKEFTRSFNITQRIGMALYLLIHQMEVVKDTQGIQIRHRVEKMAMLGLLRSDKQIWQGSGVLEDTADSLGGRRHRQIGKKNPILAKRISWPKVSELLILERQVVEKQNGKNVKMLDGLLRSFERDLPIWLEWVKGTIFEPNEDLIDRRPRKPTTVSLMRTDSVDSESEEGYDNFLTLEEFMELRNAMVQLPLIQRSETYGQVIVIEEEGVEHNEPKEITENKRWDQVLSDFEKLLIVKYLAPEEFKRHALVLLQKYFKGQDELNILESHDILDAINSANPTLSDHLVPVVIAEKSSGNDIIGNLLRNSKGSRTPTPTTPSKNTPTNSRQPSKYPSAMNTIEGGELFSNTRSFSLGHDRGLLALKHIRENMKRPVMLILKDVEYASQYFFRELLKILNDLEKGDVTDRFRLVLVCQKDPRKILPKELLAHSLNVVAEETIEFEYHFQKTMKQTDPRVWNSTIEGKKAAFALAFMHSVLLTRKQYSLWASSYDTITIEAYHLSTGLMLDFVTQEHPNTWDDLRKIIIDVAYGAVVLSEEDNNALKTFVQAFLWKNRAARGQFRFPGEMEADKMSKKISQRLSMRDLVGVGNLLTEQRQKRSTTQNIDENQATALSIKHTNERWWNQVPSELASLDQYLDFIAGISPNVDFSRMIGVHPSIQMAMDKQESYNIIDIISRMAGNQSKVSQPKGGDVKVYNPLLMNSAKISQVATTMSGQNSRVQSADQNLNIRGETEAQDLPRVTLLERDVCVILSEFMMSMPLLMQEIDAAEGVFIYDKYLRLDPISVFLKQEMERYNALIKKITYDCEQLRLAISGQTQLTRYLQELYHSLLANKVPRKWLQLANNTSVPLMNWFKQFKVRAKIIYTWLTQGSPLAYYIPAFLNPEAFFNAIIQQYIRKNNVQSELVGVFTEMQPYRIPKEIPKDQRNLVNGFYIYGLYLHNAIINMEALALQDSIEEFTECPVIMLKPSTKYELREGDYRCPVLKVPADRARYGQRNRVFTLDLLTDVPSERWLVVGAYLVCDK